MPRLWAVFQERSAPENWLIDVEVVLRGAAPNADDHLKTTHGR